eukprot:CAMPEP_0113952646 /NCGR_PEP_ID=MMETSP1339-20121228/90521_1 /TAXON_ID=94617 /ORGANISM="Fibrocapsa japonica" /LENGTH=201 /DNA_ID=CAMNT_0000961293 /DNA_START=171 /DNA_END=776 /DNA_ORIENTATION=+ /assembly_acc=CAM_ASM_000762
MAAAFQGPASFGGASMKSSALQMSEAAAPEAEAAAPAVEMSKALPFLKKPVGLDGYVGDVGFDPFGFAEVFDIKFMREAELKHGRVAMLAVLGVLVQERFHIPGAAYQNPNPIQAVADVGVGPMLQIILGVGALEIFLYKGKITILDMFEDGRVPGDFGKFWDPAGRKDETETQLKELKNGRLAMMAIGGILHHYILFGHN